MVPIQPCRDNFGERTPLHRRNQPIRVSPPTDRGKRLNSVQATGVVPPGSPARARRPDARRSRKTRARSRSGLGWLGVSHTADAVSSPICPPLVAAATPHAGHGIPCPRARRRPRPGRPGHGDRALDAHPHLGFGTGRAARFRPRPLRHPVRHRGGGVAGHHQRGNPKARGRRPAAGPRHRPGQGRRVAADRRGVVDDPNHHPGDPGLLRLLVRPLPARAALAAPHPPGRGLLPGVGGQAAGDRVAAVDPHLGVRFPRPRGQFRPHPACDHRLPRAGVDGLRPCGHGPGAFRPGQRQGAEGVPGGGSGAVPRPRS